MIVELEYTNITKTDAKQKISYLKRVEKLFYFKGIEKELLYFKDYIKSNEFHKSMKFKKSKQNKNRIIKYVGQLIKKKKYKEAFKYIKYYNDFNFTDTKTIMRSKYKYSSSDLNKLVSCENYPFAYTTGTLFINPHKFKELMFEGLM